MYWQYTTALAFSVLAVTNPVINRAVANAIGSFILGSSVRNRHPISYAGPLIQINARF